MFERSDGLDANRASQSVGHDWQQLLIGDLQQLLIGDLQQLLVGDWQQLLISENESAHYEIR